MVDNLKYQPEDLVAIVWPRQSQPRVAAGEITWQEAASGPETGWAMDADKAELVKVLIAVHDDKIEGAWGVNLVEHHAEAPPGKTRKVNRSRFHTVVDARLAYLVGMESPRSPRRNPQTTMELRDLPGHETLLGSAGQPAHGVVQLGAYVLLVTPDGRAELRVPHNAVFTVRPHDKIESS